MTDQKRVFASSAEERRWERSQDARKPSNLPDYAALCAQMAAALEEISSGTNMESGEMMQIAHTALTAYRTLSPDPQWQRVPEGCVVVPEHLSDGLLMVVGTMANYEAGADTADKDHRDWWTDVLHAINRARGEG